MSKTMKLASVGGECVACGCCVRFCPKDAIHIYGGVVAQVDRGKCIGCGRCAKVCPAAVIAVLEREVPA
jgi:ferredoxin